MWCQRSHRKWNLKFVSAHNSFNKGNGRVATGTVSLSGYSLSLLHLSPKSQFSVLRFFYIKGYQQLMTMVLKMRTERVVSPRGFFDKVMQPTPHEGHACCLPRTDMLLSRFSWATCMTHVSCGVHHVGKSSRANTIFSHSSFFWNLFYQSDRNNDFHAPQVNPIMLSQIKKKILWLIIVNYCSSY